MPLIKNIAKKTITKKSTIISSSTGCVSHDSKESANKPKSYNQVRNEVMDSGEQKMESMKQVIGKLPRKK